jgi:glycosidase
MSYFDYLKSKYFNVFILLISLFLVISCANHGDQKNSQLIEIWKIEPNQTSTLDIEKIFFADNYNIRFNDHQHFKTDYKTASNRLEITPKNGFSGLAFLHFNNGSKSYLLPVLVEEKIPVTFTYTPGKKVSEVYVMGNFNTWQRNDIPMQDQNGDGTYEATVKLHKGVYKYQFIVDGNEIWDPANPDKIPNGFGSFNSIVRVKDPDKDKIPHIYFTESSQEKVSFKIDTKKLDSKFQVYVLKNNSFLAENCYSLQQDKLEIDIKKTGNGRNILRIIPVYDNSPGNTVTVWTRDGQIIDNDEFIWQDAIIYSLMIDRFNNGNKKNDDPVLHPELADQANFQGGDLQGIIDKLQAGYFNQLGINTIWISPINETTDRAYQEWPEPHRYFTGYHGYWPVSLTDVEPRFGTREQFKKLVEIAHTKDIKILLDFVSNHVHKEHRWFKKHRDWFGTYELPDGGKNIRKWNEYRLTTWFDTFLPSFDYLNSEEALDTVTDIAVDWLKDTKIDGFRHDATKHIPEEFWKTLTRKGKAEVNPNRKTNIFQIGETFGSYEFIKSYVNNGMLDSQFNFELFFTLRRVFVEANSDFSDLKMALDKSLSIYGYNNLMGNIMDSHDQVRMMAYLDGDLDLSENGTERAWQKPKIEVDHASSYQKERMILSFLLTIPGVPIIYYGDEFGLTGANDPDNRRMMKFGRELNEPQKKQLHKISRLINIRRDHPALRRGDYLPLLADKDIFIYSRGDYRERILVAINKGDEKQNIQVKLPDWMDYSTASSLLNNEKYSVDSNFIKLGIDSYSAQILLLNN